MCDQIVHRGPDDQGFYVDGGCAIGMRRLSIIDLNTGHQPISNEDGTIWTVFNGEIYNYRELRADLIARGHRFRTETDTEVLVHLYEEYGVDGIARLRGMFGYAIWDTRKRELLLVRDRFGKKPLYYSVVPGDGIYFGSELKCLKAAGVPMDIDPEAMRLYFAFTYIPDPRSIFRQVRKVSPGGWLLFRADESVREGHYWKMPVPATEEPEGMTEEQSHERLRELFDESVRMRMIADVPLGAFLSGGVDSSAVVASMALQSNQPIKTFSVGLDEQQFSELPYAEAVAKRYGTDHHTITVRPDSAALIPKLLRHFDEPFADSSAIPTYLISEYASRHVKVILSGDGGDEVFAGYGSFFQAQKLQNAPHIPGQIRRLMRWTASALPQAAPGVRYLYATGRETALERYFEFVYASSITHGSLFEPKWRQPFDEASLRSAFGDCLLGEGHDLLTQALFFEATAKLTGDMLVKVDRMSMATSLEVRSPMLDHQLAEFGMQLPPHWKMRNGMGKYGLVRAMEQRLPREVWDRRKRGFSIPLHLWMRGSLRTMLFDTLLSSTFRSRGFVAQKALERIMQEHDSGRRSFHALLWSLLIAELWLREWNQPLAASSESQSRVA